jgi:hypothetical protein
MRQFAVIFVLVAAAGLFAACSATERVVGAINPDTVSLADSCAEFTRAAMSFADIDIQKRTSQNAGITAIVANVEGTRTDLPKDGPQPRDVAAECQFDNATLVGFHWIKGGPSPPPAPPSAPAP